MISGFISKWKKRTEEHESTQEALQNEIEIIEKENEVLKENQKKLEDKQKELEEKRSEEINNTPKATLEDNINYIRNKM